MRSTFFFVKYGTKTFFYKYGIKTIETFIVGPSASAASRPYKWATRVKAGSLALSKRVAWPDQTRRVCRSNRRFAETPYGMGARSRAEPLPQLCGKSSVAPSASAASRGEGGRRKANNAKKREAKKRLSWLRLSLPHPDRGAYYHSYLRRARLWPGLPPARAALAAFFTIFKLFFIEFKIFIFLGQKKPSQKIYFVTGFFCDGFSLENPRKTVTKFQISVKK